MSLSWLKREAHEIQEKIHHIEISDYRIFPDNWIDVFACYTNHSTPSSYLGITLQYEDPEKISIMCKHPERSILYTNCDGAVGRVALLILKTCGKKKRPIQLKIK